MESNWYDDIALPVLLGEARKTYGEGIRARLAAAGFDDMPRIGLRAVGGIARNGANLRDVASELGVSKQAASQLVDTLVLRGYVERLADETDRRRVTVGLTDRGRAAAEVINAAVDEIDAALAAKVGNEEVARTRAALGALVELRHDD